MNADRPPGWPAGRAPSADQQRATLSCLLLVTIWLFVHPWQGLYHDDRFYALQALAHLRPQTFRHDLFFFAASQDDYTFFSPIYAAFISLLGLKAAAITLLLAGYIVWAGAAAWLLRGLLHGFPAWLALLLIFAMPRGYGGYGDQLRYAEPFLTPRLFAEGSTLLSLGLLLRGKRLAALAPMAAAFALHPLMALGGAGFAALHAAQERPRAALGAAALGLAFFLGLASLNIAPFSHLLATMDREWLELAFARSPFVFWDGWQAENWLNRVLLSFSLLATAAMTAQGRHRRAFLAALLVGGAALLLTWLGTSLFHNVLLIQLQPWRALWLTQVFSYIAAAWLAGQYWGRGRVHRGLLLGFLAASLIPDHGGGILALLTASLFIWRVRSGQQIKPSTTEIRLLFLLPLLVAASWLATAWLSAAAEVPAPTGQFDHLVHFALGWIRALLAAGGSGVIALALLLFVWRYGPDQRRLIHLGAVASVLFLLFLAVGVWHRPSEPDAYYEQRALQEPIPAFSRHLPADALVYWEDYPTRSWFALGRANYASWQQTAGIVFSRATASEGKRRTERLAALGLRDSIQRWGADASHLPMASFTGLVHVCHDSMLDYLILSKDLGAGVIERHAEKVTGKHFYLYDCAYLRRNFADAWPDPTNQKN